MDNYYYKKFEVDAAAAHTSGIPCKLCDTDPGLKSCYWNVTTARWLTGCTIFIEEPHPELNIYNSSWQCHTHGTVWQLSPEDAARGVGVRELYLRHFIQKQYGEYMKMLERTCSVPCHFDGATAKWVNHCEWEQPTDYHTGAAYQLCTTHGRRYDLHENIVENIVRRYVRFATYSYCMDVIHKRHENLPQ